MADSARVARRKQGPALRDPDDEPLPQVRRAWRVATSWLARHPVARAGIQSTPVLVIACVADGLRAPLAGVGIGTAVGFGYDRWRRRRPAA